MGWCATRETWRRAAPVWATDLLLLSAELHALKGVFVLDRPR